jgi:predicted house-cleaning noncanonical NTP pyrophosphatase (MazG superfamily)
MKTYNKLVRDKIPEILQGLNKNFETRSIVGAELCTALEEKLLEELAEFREEYSIAELADLLEVILGMAEAHGFTAEQLEEARLKKANSNGGFNDGIFLIKADP